MGIMPTETELALEQSQQGVSYEVSSPTQYSCDNCQNIRVILFSIHSDDGNPSRVNIKQLCGRLWFHSISFDYRVPLGFGSIAGGLDHVNPVIRLPIEHEISRILGIEGIIGQTKDIYSDMGDDVNISMLSIEQYLVLIQDNNRPGVVKPKIDNDVEFEINSNFIRELRCKLFARTDDEDACKHVRRFIWQYCSPFKTAKKLEEIHNFKQEMGETLYHAWERYSDLFYRCLQHDLNYQQKVHIFYTRLDISTRRMLDSRGFNTLMTPTQALISIQVMADHSHNWYDETTTKEKSNDSPDNIDAIQESFKGHIQPRSVLSKKRTR
ncbi:hypothetical protein Tco_0554568 [Tanacetum coccineum]